MSDFNFEPIRGLPAKLPPRETMLWQGAPDWRVIAARTFKVKILLAYFGVLIGWKIATAFYDGRPLGETVSSLALISVLVGICIGILCLLAWGTARTTVYTITDKRVVMRYGIALTMALNIPFRRIESAGLKLYSTGHGDIPLSLQKDEKISYLVLWPHARPWRMKRPEPMLRGIPNAKAAAEILAHALAVAASSVSERNTAQETAQQDGQRPRQAVQKPETYNEPGLADAGLARLA